MFKLSKMLLGNYCRILESYLSRKFRIKYEEAKSAFYLIRVGIPLGSAILYLIFIAGIPTNKKTIIITFANDTAVMAVNKSQSKVNKNLQLVLNQIVKWTTN